MNAQHFNRSWTSLRFPLPAVHTTQFKTSANIHNSINLVSKIETSQGPGLLAAYLLCHTLNTTSADYHFLGKTTRYKSGSSLTFDKWVKRFLK